MKRKNSSLFGGLVLVLLGGFMLAFEMGYFHDLAEKTWMLIFAAASVIFWIAYFVSGVQRWGWLFPACIFAALSGTLFILDTSIAEEWIGALVVGSLAAPFVVGYLLDRSRWGLLIPAFVLGFVAFIPPLTLSMRDEWVGAFVVAMIGLPFLVATLATPKAWWAIFPAGIMLSITVLIVLLGLFPGSDVEPYASGIMFLGWSLTFGLAWLRRNQHPTAWAKYPALGMLGLAFILFLVGAGLEMYWSIGLIVAGLVMVLLSLRPRRVQADKA
jgi:hypothetical protein